jgi:hypothetical protein
MEEMMNTILKENLTIKPYSEQDNSISENNTFSIGGVISENTERIIVYEFNITEELNYLHIKLNLPEMMALFFYLEIIDSNNILRVQHLAVNGSKCISIGKNKDACSIGVYPGIICKGEWKLILVIQGKVQTDEKFYYNIELENTDEISKEKIDKLGDDTWVVYEKEKGLLNLNNYDWDRKMFNEARWYKGDFHTHSILSDGKMNDELYIKTAKEMNLDYVFPTDHNILPTGWKKSEEVLVIPGIEITLEKGHFNILGATSFPISIEKMIKYVSEYYSFEEMIVEKILHEWRDRKALYSVNHPLLEFWKWKLNEVELSKIDTIEICNDPTYYLGSDSNDKAIELLDILWNDGYQIYGIGGSDAHILPTETYENSKEKSIIGDPGTFVYCDRLTPNNVLEAVKKGHVYVSRGIIVDFDINVFDVDSEKIEEKNSYLPGDEIIMNEKEAIISYSIKVKFEKIEAHFESINETESILEAYLIQNGKIIDKKKIENGKINFTTKWKRNKYNWLRVEIRTLENKFKVYINPIYSGKKINKLNTFKDLFSWKSIDR